MFGEVCLVCSMPRLVTVRAKTHTDIFTLSKSALDEAMKDFPVSKNEIMTRAATKYGSLSDLLPHKERKQRRPSVVIAQQKENPN